MPQFDVVSFVPQLIWLGVTFLGFYLILTYYYLPMWGKTLKARQKSLHVKKVVTQGHDLVNNNLWGGASLAPTHLKASPASGSVLLPH